MVKMENNFYNLINVSLLIISTIVILSMTYFALHFTSILCNYKTNIRLYNVKDYQISEIENRRKAIEFITNSSLKFYIIFDNNETILEELNKNGNIYIDVFNNNDIIEIKSGDNILYDCSKDVLRNKLFEILITIGLIIVGIWMFIKTLATIKKNRIIR